MLSEIFKALLITSLAGSCLAAVIALSKPITKKVFGYSWHYYIWLAVLAAMILPVRFTLPQKTEIPPITATQTVQTEQTEQTTAAANADNAVPSAQEKPNMLKSGTAFVQKIIDNRLNILALLWLVGAAILLLINLIGYIRLIIKMRKNSAIVSCPELMNFTDKRVAVRVWANTSSPFMTGIFRPTLVLPDRELTEEQLNNILRHEMTHFKRHDILYKWFVSLVKCLHWFNPVIWYVAKQVNTECEISCDMAVTQNMNKSEKMSYINTVLALLPMGKTKQIPLTTQMASSKKTLRRRFTMIRNKKKTSKIMSVISALVAVVMLSTTVFASGVLSNLATDDYTIEITNNGEKIELANKPFIENGEVYVPLREIFEKAISEEEGLTDIKWNDGTINVVAAYYQGESGAYQFKIGENYMKVKHINFKEFENVSFDTNGVVISIGLRGTPLLLHSTTYVTIEDMNYMLYGFTNRRDADKKLVELPYHIYDKNGNLIDTSKNNLTFGTIIVDENNEVIFKSDDLKNPEHTVVGFFEAFSEGNFTLMKNYCTEKCQSSFFGDGYCFGMTKANIQSMNIDPLEYAKSSNDFNVFVTVNMTPHEQSVFDPRDTSTSFYVILQRQPDGRYLIDEFATGL